MDRWGKYWVAYDNMCNLVNLKVSQSILPLPEPYCHIWKAVNKMIDGLHIRNHKRAQCQRELNPKRFTEMYPELEDTKNSMAAEQTFIWAERFKKILFAMPKQRHVFYLHRMVKRRNRYTQKCHQKGKSPALPTAKSVFTT